MAIALSEFISEIRSELEDATSDGNGHDLRFELGPIEIEASVTAVKDATPGAKVRLWIVDVGVDVKLSSSAVQRVKLQLNPVRTTSPNGKALIAGSDHGER
jgi:hypothetical protein